MTSTQTSYQLKQKCSCDHSSLHLHVEIENLKQRLLERENHIVKMETNFLKEAEKFPNGEFAALTEELLTWQDKYSRLFEAHKRVQKVNQGLEDKLLKIVDKCETEKNSLQNDVTLLTKRIMEQQTNISKLHEENERYRNDLNIAIQLLQCKPSNFVPQKCDMLPPELQAKVRSYVASKQRKYVDGNGNTQKTDVKTIKVPIPTFPPTAMVYSLDTDKEQNSNESTNKQGAPVDIVSAAIMAKILKEREKERLTTKHCQTCNCSILSNDTKSSQTDDLLFSSSENDNTTVVVATSALNPATIDDREKAHLSSHHHHHHHHHQQQQQQHQEYETASVTSKPETEDLIDLNGYNSDDNYQCFKNMRKTGTTSGGGSRDNDSSKDLISFDGSTTSSEVYRGPRHCSVRVQPGSNNILLDNAAQFSSPILYKRRGGPCSGDPSSEPSVHTAAATKSRTSSVSSGYSERKLSTETEI